MKTKDLVHISDGVIPTIVNILRITEAIKEIFDIGEIKFGRNRARVEIKISKEKPKKD